MSNLSDLYTHGSDLYDNVLNDELRRILKARDVNPSQAVPLSEARRQYILGWKLHRDLAKVIEERGIGILSPECDRLFDESCEAAKKLGDWALLGWFDVPDVETESLLEASAPPDTKNQDN